MYVNPFAIALAVFWGIYFGFGADWAFLLLLVAAVVFWLHLHDHFKTAALMLRGLKRKFAFR